MILEIAKHELTRQLRDGRSKTLMVAMGFILLIASILGFSDYNLIQDQYEANQYQVRENWLNQTQKDPDDAAHDGTYVIKPMHPFAMLDKGIQQYTGKVVHLGAHERKQSSISGAKDHTGMFRFGQLTPDFILQYLIPLLLIFLGYNAFTEERERQTLKLLFAQGVSGKKLALGKWLALTIQLGLLSMVFLIICLIGFSAMDGAIPVSGIEIGVLSASYLFYFLVYVNIILLVSALVKSSGVSLTILLSVWILFTLIVPKLSTNIAGRTYPFPTLQTFTDNVNTDRENGLNGHNFWNEAAEDFKSKVLEEYGVETIEELPIAYGGLLLAEGEKYESEVYTKHFDLLRSQYAKQREIYKIGGGFSPFLPVKFVSMALARSDYDFQWRFEDQAEKYRVDFNTTLNMDIAENAKDVQGYKADKDLWASVKPFEYKWQPATTIIEGYYTEFFILLSWFGLSFTLMLIMGSKIKVS